MALFPRKIGGAYRMDPTVLSARATSLLELFGLGDQVHQRISALSYGMRSRLTLIASLLHDPKILIMDEPFFGLDPQTLRLMKQLLRDRARQGMTIVLSTHQLTVVEDVADRVAIMNQGRLIEVGGLAELRQRHGGGRLEEVFFQLTSPPRSPS